MPLDEALATCPDRLATLALTSWLITEVRFGSRVAHRWRRARFLPACSSP